MFRLGYSGFRGNGCLEVVVQAPSVKPSNLLVKSLSIVPLSV